MAAEGVGSDELAQVLRDLTAERLRPVPPAQRRDGGALVRPLSRTEGLRNAAALLAGLQGARVTDEDEAEV